MKKPSGLKLAVYVVCALLIGAGTGAIVWPFKGALGFAPTYRVPGSGSYGFSKSGAQEFGVAAVLLGLGLLYFARGDNDT